MEHLVDQPYLMRQQNSPAQYGPVGQGVMLASYIKSGSKGLIRKRQPIPHAGSMPALQVSNHT
eukprot:1159564-Pelagomonas_calceolata.AAC.7